MADHDGMRASDADREDVIKVLQNARVAGPLDLEEVRNRIGAACSARAWGEVRALTVDLPVPGGPGLPADEVAAKWPARPAPYRCAAGRYCGPGRPAIPALLIVMAWLGITTAVLQSMVVVPLAIFALSMVAVAGRFARQQPPRTRGGRRT